MYKLIENGVFELEKGLSIPNNSLNSDWQDYLRWLDEGNTPLPADVPTQAQIDKDLEISEAQPTAKGWFIGQTAAKAFIRLTPEEQATQIELMTLAQLRTVVKYLAIAVSMIIKRELL